jgi:hypothetical protein
MLQCNRGLVHAEGWQARCRFGSVDTRTFVQAMQIKVVKLYESRFYCAAGAAASTPCSGLGVTVAECL